MDGGGTQSLTWAKAWGLPCLGRPGDAPLGPRARQQGAAVPLPGPGPEALFLPKK